MYAGQAFLTGRISEDFRKVTTLALRSICRRLQLELLPARLNKKLIGLLTFTAKRFAKSRVVFKLKITDVDPFHMIFARVVESADVQRLHFGVQSPSLTGLRMDDLCEIPRPMLPTADNT